MPTITTRIINAYLEGLRLPLTAVERFMNRTGQAAWPPALAFEAFEADAKKVFGSLLHDDELVREGRLIRAKLSELGEAERLEAAAEQVRRAADARLEQRLESADEARTRIEREAQQAETRILREKAEKERVVRLQTDKRRQAAQERALVRDKVVTAREREAERTRISEESAALAQRRQALAATRRARNLDAALETKKAERKNA